MDQAPEIVATQEVVGIDVAPATGWLRNVDRMGLVSLALDVSLVAGFVWLGHSLVGRIDQTNGRLEAQMTQTEAMTQQTNALTAEHQALKSEVEQLRGFLASKSEVDVLFLKILVTKPSIDLGLARTIAQSVHRYSEEYQQDPNLVLAIIAVESDFNPRAVSNKGAQGLMQVMPQWKKILGITEDVHDPAVSVRFGLQILGFYQAMYKDMTMALTAYNRGPGPVDMALMRGQDPMNDYAPRVLKTYNHLKSLSVGKPS